MARYKVSYDKSLCIGAFACVAACPKHFAQAGDKADLIGADNAKDFFAGHPVVADNPAIVLNVARSKDWKNWLLEVHNPTDQPVTTWVRSSPHVLGLKLAEKFELKPGSSQFRDLGPTND